MSVHRHTVRQVRSIVLGYFRAYGRTHLPWRTTTHPYAILVSEIMLQQTQAERVIPYYERFIRTFPTVQALANTSLKEVLTLWSGLGYNRRAKFLYEAARAIANLNKGTFPRSYEELVALPGVGEYTAKAVRVFAYNEHEVLLETNVRTVVIHHFFGSEKDVSEKALAEVAAMLAEGQDPRTWHSALMDYGTHLKATAGNASRRSSRYVKQKPLKGSLREVRGALTKVLIQESCTKVQLKKRIAKDMHDRLDLALQALLSEEIVVRSGRLYSLAQ